MNVPVKNPADIWIVDFWIVGFELRKRSCLEIWNSLSRKGSLGEEVFMVRNSTKVIIELRDCKKRSLQ